MNNRSFDGVQLKNSLGIFGLLLLTIFTAELAVMEQFSPLFVRLGTVAGGLLDAGIVVALFTAPLWFFLARLLPEEGGAAGTSHPRPAPLLAQALAGIFLIQFLLMLLLPVLLPRANDLFCEAKALLSALLCGIPLWFLLFRPRMRRRSVPLMDTPLRLYVLLLCTIFLSDLTQEFLLPFRAASDFLGPKKTVDAFVTTLFGAPLLWLLVARPLNRAARSEKARVAALYAQVIDAIVVIDPQGVINSFNPAAEKIFGYGAREMIGGSAALFLEEGHQGLNGLVQSVAARADGQASALFEEIRCKRRDGSAIIMNVSISEVHLEQRREFLLIMRDITDRKAMEEALRESEARFRQIFLQSEDAILFFKPGGCMVLDANANAERIFGYSKAELRDGALDRIFAAAELSQLSRAIAGIVEGRGVRQDLVCRRSDHEEITVSMHGKSMLLQEVTVTYCTFRNITERVRMEERTREIQAKLIQTNKMASLGLLVSGVAHEINNPNNFIMANCEILAKISADTIKVLDEYIQEQPGNAEIHLGGIPLTELGDHTRRLFGGISEGSRRVNDIVNSLKGFARQELRQVKREVDMSQVARSAVSLLHHELIKHTANFHLDLADQLPPITGHSQQLGQVIINLLMNACQALPGRQSAIWLSSGYDQASGLVTISVRDEGKGMSWDDGQRIMEPFFTTKLDCGGTGLGLSISESIVKEHGGTLEFKSVPGQGTIFEVRIPAAQVNEKEQA